MNSYAFTVYNPPVTVLGSTSQSSSPKPYNPLTINSGINTQVAGNPLIWIEFKSKTQYDAQKHGKLPVKAY